MLNEPIISVVIDTYNYAKFIERAIESVLNQTFPSDLIEIIVVDDGSQDDTDLRVMHYEKRVLYHRKENGGQASAFNEGVSLARGKYVSFLDADDYFYPTKIENILKIFEGDESIGVVYNKYDMVDDHGNIISYNMPLTLYGGDIKYRIAMGHVIGVPSSGISIRRELGLMIPIPESPFRISADYFMLSIYPVLAQVGVVGTTEHAYRVHSSNLYLKKEKSEQSRIHVNQNASIYATSENLGFAFFRAIHDLSHSQESSTLQGRLRIFLSGVIWILSSKYEMKLRTLSLLKLVAKFSFPTYYKKMIEKKE